MRAPGGRPGLRLSWPFLLLALAPWPGSGQGFPGLVDSCAAPNQGLLDRCRQGALALDAARGALTLAASGGSEVAGSASTLGFRLRRLPRLALSARAGVTRASVPGITRGYSLPIREESFFLPALQVTGTVGLFDGFSPLPTVGGILALDVSASAHKLFPPKDRGFLDGSTGWGVAGRLGILRESFTLPGVSVSLAHRSLGEGRLGDMNLGDPAEARFDVSATSLRGVVGKDLFGIGILAGVGWDRSKGDGSVGVRVSPSGFELSASGTDLASERVIYFAGSSLTFLILQVSAEGGWSRAVDSPLPRTAGGGGEADLGAWFASLALRLTL